METFLATFSMYGVSKSILLKHFFFAFHERFYVYYFSYALGS